MAGEQAETQAPVVDIMAMSDEDFLNANQSELQRSPSLPTEDQQQQEPSAPVVDSEEDLGEDTTTDTETDETAEEAVEEESDKDTQDDGQTRTSENDATEESTEQPSSEESTDSADSTSSLESEVKDLKRILEPFKANGVEVQAKTPEEAIQLMQMGANYGKKMAALKPNLNLLKTLEKYGLNDQEKLNHLIDLSKGNPEAIAKLIEDAKVDPLAVEQSKGNEYKPNDYSVSEAEVELDEAIKSIQETPHGQGTLQAVQTWDKGSKDLLAQHPRQLQLLNEHKGNGVFDKVNQEVQRQKMNGGLIGLSDLQAYQRVGLAMDQAGAFGNAQAETPKPVVEKPATKPKKPSAKKRAAGSVKDKASTQKPLEYDIMRMSDEDFLKLPLDKFK